MALNPNRLRRLVVTAAIIGGAGLGAAGVAAAASTTTTTHAQPNYPRAALPHGAPTGAPQGAPGNPATLNHGPDETLLTGSDLTQATSAAQSAEPGASVLRAETNSSGASAYEVHMTKADGSVVTVLLDSSFAVTGTVDGFGAGPAGQAAPQGASTPSSSSATNAR